MKSLIFFLIVCLSSLCKLAVSQPAAPGQGRQRMGCFREKTYIYVKHEIQ
jgi:hypothetical protein